MPATESEQPQSAPKTVRTAKARKAVRKGGRKARSAVKNAEDSVSGTLEGIDERIETAERKAHAAAVHTKYKVLSAKDAIQRGMQRSEEWVQKHPIKAVAGAAAIGWLAAKLLGRRK